MSGYRIRPSAVQDLRAHAAFYCEQAGFELALRFSDAANRTFRLISTQPSIGRQCNFEEEGLIGIRWLPIVDFEKYLVFYRMTGEVVEVLRVIHGARDIEAAFGSSG